eukprot:631756-Pelagomonas_calceolata.AAC.11
MATTASVHPRARLLKMSKLRKLSMEEEVTLVSHSDTPLCQAHNSMGAAAVLCGGRQSIKTGPAWACPQVANSDCCVALPG